MKLMKEPLEIDLQINSEKWMEKDLSDFREMMTQIKNKSKHRRINSVHAGKNHLRIAI